MEKSARIRPVALGLIQDGDRLFVGETYHPEQQKHFYRALGGGIEFGETSLQALQREFQEELQAELTNIHYLGCIENLFTYCGKACHELIQLYGCEFVDRRFYELEQISFLDGSNTTVTARWIHCDRVKSGELWFVPEESLRFVVGF